MTHELRGPGVRPALALVLTALVYLPSAGGRAVIDYDEGYYSQAAAQMVARRDWVTPYADGVRFLEKPPLMYWTSAVSFLALGVDEFALRLPTALAVVALVWLVVRMARRASGERAAIVSGLAAAFSAGTYLFTREALHDVWLVLFVTLAMHAFLEWHLDPLRSRRHALVFFAALAGAMMSKSLIGVAFPVGAVGVFYLLSWERPRWRSVHVVAGSALFLLLVVPWHALAAARNPGFLRAFFLNEQILRSLGRHDPPVLWSVPLVTFLALIPVWFFPWTAFLPAALAAARGPADERERALLRLALAWSGVVLVYCSMPGRLEHYTFPMLPPLALLVGLALGREASRGSVTWGFRGLAVLGVVVLVAGAGAGLWLVASGAHGLQGTAAARTAVVSETDFSILGEMPPAVLRNLLPPAGVTILALALGFPAALWLEARRRRLPAVLGVTAVMVVVCGMTHWSLRICEDLISSKAFGLTLAREARPGDRLVVVGDYESANSLSFYQPLRVEVCDGAAYALIPGMRYPDAPKIVLTRDELLALWKAPGRVFALVPRARLSELAAGGVEVRQVLERVLVRNR